MASRPIKHLLPKPIVEHPAFDLATSESKYLVFVIFSITTVKHINELPFHSTVRGALPLIRHVDFVSAQRLVLLAKSELFKLLVSKLMQVERKLKVRRPNYHMNIMFQHHHWRVSECMRHRFFIDGRRLYAQGKFSLAAQRWGQAALMQDKVSHAIVADMLIEGRPGVPKDPKKAFEIATQGKIIKCVHSIGVLGRCYLMSIGCSPNIKLGDALACYSAEIGDSCFGWHASGLTFYLGLNKSIDYIEAERCFQEAAAHDHAGSLNILGYMYQNGLGVHHDYDEALRYYEQAAKQGFDVAIHNFKILSCDISRMHETANRSDND